jgi:hypothetical protein
MGILLELALSIRCGNATLHSGAGNGLLYGHAGNDILCGDAGADPLYGGLGADIFYLGEGDIAPDFPPSVDTMFLVELPLRRPKREHLLFIQAAVQA